jgi:nucleolar protein TMA23
MNHKSECEIYNSSQLKVERTQPRTARRNAAMDAHALLTSQGWRGSGHSLHPTSDKNGLSRPLLVSRKQNNLGVGKKQHKTSDMWWMNAFDKSLKGLDTAQDGRVVQTLTNGGLDMVAKGGSKFVGNVGLYASFVKGESLSGTITPEESERPEAAKKRRRVESVAETKEERRARKAAKRTANLLPPVSTDELVPTTEEKEDTIIEKAETKEQRRERRKQKKLMRQEREDGMRDGIVSPKRKKRPKD